MTRVPSGIHWVLSDHLTKTEWGFRGIAPLHIWRRTTGHVIVQVLSKDDVSHCLYFLNETYSDPDFTYAEDVEDPMVIMNMSVGTMKD